MLCEAAHASQTWKLTVSWAREKVRMACKVLVGSLCGFIACWETAWNMDGSVAILVQICFSVVSWKKVTSLEKPQAWKSLKLGKA